MKAWLKWTAGLVLVIGVCTASVGPLFGPKVRAVPTVVAGYREVRVMMAHRGTAEDVHIWYPATEGPVSLIGQNAVFYGFYGRKDAKPAATSAPVVVLSHGSGGNARALGWLASGLAAQGMIVVAPNHLGTMSADSDPQQTPMIWQRVQDMRVALDYLATQPFGLQADMTRVAALGFSLGGGAALVMSGARLSKADFIAGCATAGKPDCDWMRAHDVDFTAIDQEKYEADWRDARIGVTVAIDPALAGAMRQVSAVTHPVTLINLGSPDKIGPMRVDDLAKRLPNARYQFVEAARHFSFLAECSQIGRVIVGGVGDDNICDDKGLLPRAEVHSKVLALISAALDQGFSLREGR